MMQYGFIDMRYELIGLPVERLDEKHIVGKSRWVIYVDEENNSVDSELTFERTKKTSSINNNLPSTSHTHPSSSSSSSSISRKRPHDDVVNGDFDIIILNRFMQREFYKLNISL